MSSLGHDVKINLRGGKFDFQFERAGRKETTEDPSDENYYEQESGSHSSTPSQRSNNTFQESRSKFYEYPQDSVRKKSNPDVNEDKEKGNSESFT